MHFDNGIESELWVSLSQGKHEESISESFIGPCGYGMLVTRGPMQSTDQSK